jgi:hypothetical protein
VFPLTLVACERTLGIAATLFKSGTAEEDPRRGEIEIPIARTSEPNLRSS